MVGPIMHTATALTVDATIPRPSAYGNDGFGLTVPPQQRAMRAVPPVWRSSGGIAVNRQVESRCCVAELADGWRCARDESEIQLLLCRLNLGRQQAYQLVPNDLVYRVETICLASVLTTTASAQLPIAVVNSNYQNRQVVCGAIRCLQSYGVLYLYGRQFKLSIQLSEIASLYVVRMPGKAGMVTALEAMDSAGRTVVALTGQPDFERRESIAWRMLLASLNRQPKLSPL